MSSGNRYISSTPVARSIPFDNSTNGFDSDNVQGAIEEVQVSASPAWGFGDTGNVTPNSWLLAEGSSSFKSGRLINLTQASLASVMVTNDTPNTFDVEVWEHDGTTYTLIYTLNVVSARVASSPTLSLSLTTGKELGVKIVSGSAKNPKVGLILKGKLI